MLLSIIIPIYKVEKYILNTLNSIYNQEFDESIFEVICVNDGTPDCSMDIVKEFKLTHKNLQVINQMNQGLSCARNAGLRIAQGEYVWFVDSDDSLETGSLSQTTQYIKSDPDTEILGFDIVRVQEASKKEKIEHVILKEKNFHLYNLSLHTKDIIHKTHIAPVQRFIFKHSFLRNHHLTFYPKIYHEDMEFMSKAFFLANQIKFIKYAPYRYLVRDSGSIMSSVNIKSVTDKMTIVLELNHFKQKYAINRFEKAYFDDITFYLIRSILKYPQNNEIEFKKMIAKKRKEIKTILIKGLQANWYFADIKKCIIAIIILIKLNRLFSIQNTDN